LRPGNILQHVYNTTQQTDLLVMSRRDAHKAHRDEVLMRSTDYKQHAKAKKDLSNKLFKMKS
jgi:hypothetical protein